MGGTGEKPGDWTHQTTRDYSTPEITGGIGEHNLKELKPPWLERVVRVQVPPRAPVDVDQLKVQFTSDFTRTS